MKRLTPEDIRGYIGKTVSVKMDQPIGSSYSGHGEALVYPVNYGFVPNTKSGDDDDKLVVVPHDASFTDGEIKELTWFQERFFISEIWR